MTFNDLSEDQLTARIAELELMMGSLARTNHNPSLELELRIEQQYLLDARNKQHAADDDDSYLECLKVHAAIMGPDYYLPSEPEDQQQRESIFQPLPNYHDSIGPYPNF